MSFTVEHVEFYLLVLIRITSFVIGAPIFGYQTIPMKIRLAIGMVLSLAAIQTVPVIELNYVGVLGFSVLVLKEMICALTLFLLPDNSWTWKWDCRWQVPLIP